MRISNIPLVRKLFLFVGIVAGLAAGSVLWDTVSLLQETAPPAIPYQAPHPPIAAEIPPAETAPITAHVPGFRDRLEKATVQFYANIGGSTRFICTATAIQKTQTGYIFLTARHCVAIMSASDFYVVVDPKSDTPFIRATVLLAGGPDTDAAIVSINTPLDIPTIPVGDERLTGLGARVEYFGFPLNLGKLYFEGYVSANKIGPPAYPEPQWNGDLGLTIQVGPGSSGSALVDPNQEAIVGVVTGLTVKAPGGIILTMATPASKVRTLVTDYKTGRAPKNQDDADPFENMLRKFFNPNRH